ncbi:hypothetical protein TorRG33x02_083130, partial [Trema orientale]
TWKESVLQFNKYYVQVMLGKYILNKSTRIHKSHLRYCSFAESTMQLHHGMFTFSVQKSKIKIEEKRREKFSFTYLTTLLIQVENHFVYKNKITATRLIIKNAQHSQDNFGCGDIPEKPLSSVEEELNV